MGNRCFCFFANSRCAKPISVEITHTLCVFVRQGQYFEERMSERDGSIEREDERERERGGIETDRQTDKQTEKQID